MDKRFQDNTMILVDFKDGCFVDNFTEISLRKKIFFGSDNTDYEIIGNRYKNKDLLDESTVTDYSIYKEL